MERKISIILIALIIIFATVGLCINDAGLFAVVLLFSGIQFLITVLCNDDE